MKTTETTSRSNAQSNEVDDPISIPLYVSGLVVSIVGIIAVNSALSDDQFDSTTMMLTCLGFLFSIACRWLRIKLRVLEMSGTCLALYFGYRYVTHTFSLSVFIPPDVTQGDMIMAIVLEWLTVARAWALSNDESVVFTAVTSIAMIGLVGASNLNEELLVYFFIYMVFATFLLLHHTYLTQRAWTAASSDDESEFDVIKTQIFLSVTSGVVALLLGMVVVIPLRAIGSHLSLSNALRAFVGNQKAGDQGNSNPDAAVQLADMDTFSIGTGAGDSATSTVVMRVNPADSQEHYYRGRDYDVYEGNGWVTSLESDAVRLRASPSPAQQDISAYVLQSPSHPGGDHSQPAPVTTGQPLETHFTVVASTTSALYVPYGTEEVDLEYGLTSVKQSADNFLSLRDSESDGFAYTTWSYDNQPSPEQLEGDIPLVSNIPSTILQEYVGQRGSDVVSIDDQSSLLLAARQIISELPPQRRTELNEAEAIRQWVSRRCLYSLNVDPVPANDDAVSYFLFTTRKGYCDLFASSMAILCRYAGLPARVATGFAPGVYNKGGWYDLRERDKHAWVEVWFPKYGWQIFDPTVGAKADSSVTNPGAGNAWLNNVLAKVRLFFEFGGFWALMIRLVIVLALLYVFKTEVYDKFISGRVAKGLFSGFKTIKDAKAKSPEAAAAYAKDTIRGRYSRYLTLMRRLGLAKLPSQTPIEFLKVVHNQLVGNGIQEEKVAVDILEAAALITQEVMLASYAPVDLVGEALVKAEEDGTGETALKLLNDQSSLLLIYSQSGKEKAALR